MLESTKELLPMRLRGRLELQHYEQRLLEIRKERKAETKQVERLSAILMKSEFRRSQETPQQGPSLSKQSRPPGHWSGPFAW
jgi:hypothetical protein